MIIFKIKQKQPFVSKILLILKEQYTKIKKSSFLLFTDKSMKPFILFIANIISFPIFAQLSGNYTIGGSNPSFPTISDAISSLSINGVSGPTIFNIRPGTYNENISVNNIEGNSSSNTITFQSENLDSTSVIITSAKAETIITTNCFIIFNKLSLTNKLKSVIKGQSNNNITIKSCYIFCNNNYDMILLNNGDIKISECNIVGDIKLGYSIVSHNKIYGDFSLTYCKKKSQINNNFIYGNANFIYSNYTKILNNIFYKEVQLLYSDSNQFINNTLFDNCLIGYSRYAKILVNKFNKGVAVGYSDSSEFSSNKVSGNIDWSFSDRCLISNNFIYRDLYISLSYKNSIYNNNFSIDTITNLKIEGTGNILINNNMPHNFTISSLKGNTIKNNNYYYPFGGLYDSLPWCLNPRYSNNKDLHSLNPQLNGKGISILSVQFDIDSNKRFSPPSIGANEVCIAQDTIDVDCGDSIQLSFCSLPQKGNYIWNPNIGLNNNNIINPKASPNTPTMYKVKETISGFEDSIFVNVVPFKFRKKDEILINCADSVQIVLDNNSSSVYQWSPTIGVKNPNSYRSILKPTFSTQYIITANNRCGIVTDTININVNPLPKSIFQFNKSGFTTYFNNESTCANNYLWDFGDSIQSTDISPTHVYKNEGTYIIKLIAYNNYGSDTALNNINIFDNTSIELINKPNIINIYPNPVSSILNIESNLSEYLTIKLYNTSGKELIQNVSFIKSGVVNIEMLSDGLYFINVYDKNGTIIKTQKISVIKW